MWMAVAVFVGSIAVIGSGCASAANSTARPQNPVLSQSFRLLLSADRGWFSPRERLTGKILAASFDGLAIANATGEARLIGAGGGVLQKASVLTNRVGEAVFDFDSPPGEELGSKPVCSLQVGVSLNDTTGRSANGSTLVYVGISPIIVSATVEAGELASGRENRVYLVAKNADGTPAQTHLGVKRLSTGEVSDVETNSRGEATYLLANPKGAKEVLEFILDYKDVESQHISLPVRSQ